MTPNAMPVRIATKAPSRKARVPRPIRNTQMADQLKEMFK